MEGLCTQIYIERKKQSERAWKTHIKLREREREIIDIAITCVP